MPAKSTFSLDDVPAAIAARFDEAQKSLANHRKNCVALHKLHVQASRVKDPGKKNEDALTGEWAFGDAFIDMVNRTLAMKKGAFADRIVRFVGSYVKMMNDKVTEDRTQAENQEETFASRFVTRLLEWLFQGFKAKNKMVRQRSIQLVIEMMVNIGEIDESTYNQLRDNLIERLCDKEPLIRAHAAIALSKLVGTEDPEELKQGETTCLDLLLDCTQYDTAPTPSRTYQSPCHARNTSGHHNTHKGHGYPYAEAGREDITKVGLGDREATVRVAAGNMITKWLDIAMSEQDPPGQPPETWVGDDGGVMKGFINFLTFFDVVGPGEAIAVDAMLSVFTTKPALLDAFVFNDDFWANLIPESAVLARVFVDQCLQSKSENRLEDAAIPVVTAFAFHIQEAYNALLSLMQEMDFLQIGEPDDEESEAREEELAKKELILGELLRIALNLDYMDEIGRRKVFSVVKDMLAHPHLPPGLIEHCLDVLSKILPSERELIRIVVEIIIELRDDDEVEPVIDDNFDGSRSDITQKERSMRRSKDRHEMTPEEQQQNDLTDMRCLVLCIGMLERVNGTFEDNSTLEGILTDLIVPAVKRKELALREKGLVALGLCCLIAHNMATNSFQLFLNQVQTAPEDLKLKVLQIVFDLLVVYDRDFLGRSEEISRQIVSFILQTLDSEESPAIQSVLCTGMCKLLLLGQVTDSKVLLSLALIYISPSTMDNAELKQCLSYFFPVYCYSSRENQNRMQSIFSEAFDLASRMHEYLEDEQKEDPKLVSLHQFGLLMIDWTDMTKLVEKVPPPKPSDRNPHADLALQLLLALYDSERSDDTRKAFCQFLGQLQFFPSKEVGLELDNRTVLKLNILIENLQEQCPFDDASLDRTFKRVKDRFQKGFGRRLENIDPGRYVDAEFEKFYEDIGMEVPEATGEPINEELFHEEPTIESVANAIEVSDVEEEDEEYVKEYVEEEDTTDTVAEDLDKAKEAEETFEITEKEEEEQSTEDEDAVETGEQQLEKEDDDEEDQTQPSKTQSKLKGVSAGAKSKSRFTRSSKSSNGHPDEEDEEDVQIAKAPARRGRSRRTGKMDTEQNTDARQKRRSAEAKEVLLPLKPSSVVTTSPMKKAGKRTRASQRESQAGPSTEPVSPIRKKRAGGRSRSRREAEQEQEPERDASPSPKPKTRSKPRVTPKRGRGSRAVAASWSGNAPEEEEVAGDGLAEREDNDDEEQEDEQKEEEEEAQRQPSPSPIPQAKSTRSSRASTRSRTSGQVSTKANEKVSKQSRPEGKENGASTAKAKLKERAKEGASAESSKPPATRTRTRSSRRKQEKEMEVDGFDSDI
ncbi:condensin subunit cnd3 [Lentinula edodes]|uniref:Condensin subunit cnd3 n=1 Tax=Lentinula edodes TaxID=5353 RepID=A0A1Q3DY93_LENED|nr:condensin subunit cnd3 [Lentinula edodes]